MGTHERRPELRPVVHRLGGEPRCDRKAEQKQLVRKMVPAAVVDRAPMDLVVDRPKQAEHPIERPVSRSGSGDRPAHDRERGGEVRRGAEQAPHRVRFRLGVAVQEHDGVAVGPVEDLVEREALALARRLNDQPHAGVRRRDRPDPLDRPVGAAARDDPDLAPNRGVPELLVGEGPDRGRDGCFFVVRDDPADERYRRSAGRGRHPPPGPCHALR